MAIKQINFRGDGRSKKSAKGQISMPTFILDSTPKDWRWVTYDYCKYIANWAGVTSYRQYRAFVRDYKPGGIPSRPEYVYDEWVSWGVFLNNTNTFIGTSPASVQRANLMSFWDAVAIVQQLGFNTFQEYTEAHHAGLIDKLIPANPHIRYRDFYEAGGMANWLGKKIKNRVAASKNLEHFLILYNSNPHTPNVVSILVYKHGRPAMVKMFKENQMNVIKIYHWEQEVAELIFNILNHFGTKQDETTWMFSNFGEARFEIDNILKQLNLTGG